MEKFDLYDENRNKLNITINRGDKLPENTYRLVVHLIIFNSKGEMLIQQRHPHKKNWPSLWDISVGGCVTAGETSVEAMIRETIEEIGIDLSKYELVYVDNKAYGIVIYDNFKLLLESQEEYAKMANASNPYGDGTASKQIVSILKANL